MLLTAETEGANVVHIRADIEGLDTLIGELTRLRNAHENIGHAHLFTELWGGDELTESKQSQTTELVHYVIICKWAKRR